MAQKVSLDTNFSGPQQALDKFDIIRYMQEELVCVFIELIVSCEEVSGLRPIWAVGVAEQTTSKSHVRTPSAPVVRQGGQCLKVESPRC